MPEGTGHTEGGRRRAAGPPGRRPLTAPAQAKES